MPTSGPHDKSAESRLWRSTTRCVTSNAASTPSTFNSNSALIITDDQCGVAVERTRGAGGVARHAPCCGSPEPTLRALVVGPACRHRAGLLRSLSLALGVVAVSPDLGCALAAVGPHSDLCDCRVLLLCHRAAGSASQASVSTRGRCPVS